MINIDNYLKNYIEKAVKRADELLEKSNPEVSEELFLEYFETGNRLEYERKYFEKREHLSIFGFVVSRWSDIFIYNIKEPDLERYLLRLLNVLEDVINEKTWVLPAHATPEHLKEDKVTIDLFAAETSGAVSEILFLISQNKLVKTKYQSQYNELVKLFVNKANTRIIKPFLNKEPYDWWEYGEMNWTAVCSSNMFITANYLKMLDNMAISNIDVQRILSRVTKSMISYLDGMGSDGVCKEGIDYFKYGMEYFLRYYEILEELENYKELYQISEFENIALFSQNVYLGKGNSVNFSDCSLKSKSKIGMISYLSYLFPKVSLSKDFFKGNKLLLDESLVEILGGSECHRWLGTYLDYMWVKRYGENLKIEENIYSSFFKDSMWYIHKWNDNSSFYIKGGDNEESHNHNDIGSFGYIINGEEILSDLGYGEYSKEYFGKERYSILCNSSSGHNVPIIHNNYQLHGKEYGADKFYKEENKLTISFGKAYGINSNQKVERIIEFKDSCKFVLKDLFTLDNEGTITETLVTRIKPEIKENIVFINSENAKVEIRYDENTKPYIEETTYKSHNGVDMKVYLIKADYINNQTVYIIEIHVGNVIK